MGSRSILQRCQPPRTLPFLAALGVRDDSRLGQPNYVDPVTNSLFLDIGGGASAAVVTGGELRLGATGTCATAVGGRTSGNERSVSRTGAKRPRYRASANPAAIPASARGKLQACSFPDCCYWCDCWGYGDSATTESLRETTHSVLAGLTIEDKVGQLTQYRGEWSQTGPAVMAGGEDEIRAGKVGSFLGIFGAAYTLWMYKRVYLGPVTNDKVRGLTDINSREFLMLGMLAVAVLVMGLYPKPFTDIMNVSVADFLKHVAASKL